MLTTEGIPVFSLEIEIGQWLREVLFVYWNQVLPYLGAAGTNSAVVPCSVALYCQTVTVCCLFYFV
jgi:hypothetical protein